jgi:hypothetical protein
VLLTGKWFANISMEKNIMSSAINPEAAPSITQSFEQSDRNPPVVNYGGSDAGGGQVPTPASSASRVTEPGPAPSANAGLQNYDTGDSADSVPDDAEHES